MNITYSIQLLSNVRLFETPWTASRQAFLSITDSWSLLKLMSIALVIPSNHFILCRPLLLPPSIFPGIRVFSNESVLRIRWPKYWSFSFSISPSNEYSGLISFRIDCLDLLAVQWTRKSLLQHHSSKVSIYLSIYKINQYIIWLTWHGLYMTLDTHEVGFPGSSVDKESACKFRRHRRPGLIPGSGRSPGEGNGNPLQYFCLENPMDKGAWWATVHGGHKELDTTQVTEYTHMHQWSNGDYFRKVDSLVEVSQKTYTHVENIHVMSHEYHTHHVPWIPGCTDPPQNLSPAPVESQVAVSFSSLEEGGFGLGSFGDKGTALILSDLTFKYSLDCRTSVEILMKHFHVYFCSFLYCRAYSIYLFVLFNLPPEWLHAAFLE